MRTAVGGWVVMVGLAGTGWGAAPLPPGPPAPGACEDACDYTTGDHCPIVRESALTPFPYDAETLVTLEAYVISCAGEWDGPGGCYEARVKKAVDELIAPSKAIVDVSDRAALLPDRARDQCAEREPENAQRAVDEAAAWCVIGRDECVEGLREAHRALRAMPAWAACVERMERYADANAGRVICAEHEREPAPRITEPNVPNEPRPAPKREVVRERPLEVVRVDRGRVRGGEVGGEVGPEPALREPLIAGMQAERPRADIEDAVRPAPRDLSDRRKGQFELTFAPFSGTLTMRDPGSDVQYSPNMASIGVGVDIVLKLSDDLVLELGLWGRAAFASTAVGEAITAGLEQLNIDTGTALSFDVEPSVTLLSEYVGVGAVVDLRWDTVAITDTSGLVSTANNGAAAGLRFVAGLGLLARELRLVGSLDLMFIGAGSTAVRAAIQGEIGPFILSGGYRQYFRLGSATEAYLVDDLSLTLGYRSVF